MIQWIVNLAITGLLFSGSVSLLYAQVFTNFDYTGAKLIKRGAEADEFLKSDGTRIFKYRDKEKAVFPDGTEILRYADGKRVIAYPDGMRLHIEYDGTRKYVFANGGEKTISLDGKTPYGEDIKQIEKRIKGDAFSLVVIYSAELSDDQLDGIAKRFFDELISAASSRIRSGNLKSNVKLVVSNCKFAMTGHCRRKKKKEIAVILYRGETQQTELTLDYEKMYKKEYRDGFISTILMAIF